VKYKKDLIEHFNPDLYPIENIIEKDLMTLTIPQNDFYRRYRGPLIINGTYTFSHFEDIIEGIIFTDRIPDEIEFIFNGIPTRFQIRDGTFMPKGFFIPIRGLVYVNVGVRVFTQEPIHCHLIAGIFQLFDIIEYCNKRKVMKFTYDDKKYVMDIVIIRKF
jgi:hypothetical protein